MIELIITGEKFTFWLFAIDSPLLISAFLGAKFIGWNNDDTVVKELKG